ncbi:unnamed protein product [Mycena citricolor]|uniref:BRCT domain-containing protein n=1 Tax=Mycena citricolor TaxID=2018698 RepID=A0AAD2K6C2_9AGAR|nr:unnamed protein product [Mycena citricolor]
MPGPETLGGVFIDNFGNPLSVYIDHDIDNRDDFIDLLKKHGGISAPGYSGVSYLLVDPCKTSGQNLFRLYANKKDKIVLDVRWIQECVKADGLRTFRSDWAGCKVTGNEIVVQDRPGSTRSRPAQQPRSEHAAQEIQQQQPLQPTHPQIDPLAHAHYAFPVYATHPQWQTAPIGPEQAHIPAEHVLHRTSEYRQDATQWVQYQQPVAPVATSAAPYDYRYRDDGHGWVGAATSYYDPSFVHYHPGYLQNGASSEAEPSSLAPDPSPTPVPEIPPASPPESSSPAEEPTRGRKRTRPPVKTLLSAQLEIEMCYQTTATLGASTSSLVTTGSRSVRSPTPPTRVVKSTFGGNLFTAEDILYLEKYIAYCHDQGLVLSLREICERIAVKAPHHTFYSWRRYCNKHQIRLGGYAMKADRAASPENASEDDENTDHNSAVPPSASSRPPGGSIHNLVHEMDSTPHDRSPSPPRALFRSTTGKGVAFTDEDITFLVRFMEYRKKQGKLDMVAFWKDVAVKAPHHSRASWMKFWRRHKHELEQGSTDSPLPHPPEKKMRYSRNDDVLLAKYFVNKVEGTSDKIFQAFACQHPHHPWKGWQEHHRIHKAKIDGFIQRLLRGETLEQDGLEQ